MVNETGTHASMIETAESLNRRRGTEKPLSATEQRELKATTNKTWENSGWMIQSKV